MWVVFSFLSAIFAGITAILSKIGVRNIKSELATAIRTIVVFLFAWLIVFVAGTENEIFIINQKTFTFLILSGIATGASWICYFKALQSGTVNRVTPIDKSSTVLSMLLAFVFLKEELTLLKGICMVLIGVGTYLMIEKKDEKKENITSDWAVWAILSAVFAALTSILGKIGISDISSELGTAIRTSVVLIMAWIIAVLTGSCHVNRNITKKNLFYLFVSGITTGLSWYCYYKALKDGIASVVVPIDKLSILVTIAFSCAVLKERLSRKAVIGLILLTAGTLLLIM